MILEARKSSVDVINAGSDMIITIRGSTMVMKMGAVLLAMKVGCVGAVLPQMYLATHVFTTFILMWLKTGT